MCTTSFAVRAYAHDIIPQQLLLCDELTTSLHYEGTSTIVGISSYWERVPSASLLCLGDSPVISYGVDYGSATGHNYLSILVIGTNALVSTPDSRQDTAGTRVCVIQNHRHKTRTSSKGWQLN